MSGATTGDPNQSLIDDPNFVSYLDELDRGLRTSNRPKREEELPLPELSRPPAQTGPEDPNVRTTLETLDWALTDGGASHEPAGSSTIVPQLLRHQPPPTAVSSARSRAPAASSAPGPPATTAGERPLRDLFPVDAANAARAIAAPAVQTRARQLRRDLSDAPMPRFSDAPADDSNLSPDPTAGDGEGAAGRAPP